MWVIAFRCPHPSKSLSEPSGRNKEYLDLAIKVTTDIVFDGFLLNLIPNALKP